MRFTLWDFLSLPMLERYTVLTPETDRTAPIEHISVIEPPVDNFVRQHELVLTTAWGCRGNLKKFRRFVSDIYKSGASALVVTFQDENETVPEAVLDFANVHHFPIVLIPWEYRFAEIVENVLHRIRINNRNEDSFYEDLQKNLLLAYLNAGSLDDAARLISERLEIPVVVVDINFEVKGSLREGDVRTTGEADIKDCALRVKIEMKDKIYGYLVLLGKVGEWDYEMRQLKRFAVMPLTLWFDKELAVSNARLQLKDDFIWELAKGVYTDYAEMVEKAGDMGFCLEIPYTCIVGKAGFHKTDHTNLSEINEERWIENNIGLIQAQIMKTAKQMGKEIMTTFQRGTIILFLENYPQDNQLNIHKFLDALEHKLFFILPSVRYSWGISQTDSEQGIFSRLYTNAQLALDICFHAKGLGVRNDYQDTSIFRVLTALSTHKDIRKMVLDAVNKLVQYDREKNLNLISTFEFYIQNSCNVSQTARALFLHRQSLLYRLRKIEELAGISLDNHNDVFFLELCVRMYTTLQLDKMD